MAQQDAESAFREFVESRLHRLRHLAYLMCGDMHHAEDAVQQSLTKLYAVWHRTEFNSADAYANRIVINTVKSQRSLAWFRRERPTDAPPERLLDDGNPQVVDRIVVLTALAKLPKRQRAVIVLRYWEDRSVEDTANILRCTQGTVKSHSVRGLKRLRELLAGSEYVMNRSVENLVCA